jgi:hypothetical protein
MSDEERKKVALRFLKETGLLLMWKRYIQYCPENKHGASCNWEITKENWYKKEYISSGGNFNQYFEEYSVFGNTCFTDYLQYNGIVLNSPCFRYYATYLIEKGYVDKIIWKPSKFVSRKEFLKMFPNVEL